MTSQTKFNLPIPTLYWKPDAPAQILPGVLCLLDQTLLPLQTKFVAVRDTKTLWHAIKTLQVRGAPAIGIAAAFGIITAIQHSPSDTPRLYQIVCEAADYLAASRPTAVNLFWALDRMKLTAEKAISLKPAEYKERLLREAQKILEEDLAMCRAIGEAGAALLKDGQTVLTHCNAGGLATSGYGTALAPIYIASEQGKKIRVYSDETRPLLQGARLTAWELQQAGIEVIVICDNMAAQVMREGHIDLIMVGADRIAANGDTANKIGTYGLAVLAQAHKIPFYILAPSSTFDFQTPDGDSIPIEERGAEEITCGFGKRTAPLDIAVYAPAFDVTPAALITGIICEHGILSPPFTESLRLS